MVNTSWQNFWCEIFKEISCLVYQEVCRYDSTKLYAPTTSEHLLVGRDIVEILEVISIRHYQDLLEVGLYYNTLNRSLIYRGIEFEAKEPIFNWLLPHWATMMTCNRRVTKLDFSLDLSRHVWVYSALINGDADV